MGRLSGKVALVSGGASGIGAAICAEFALHDCKVLVTDIQVDKGRAVAEAIASHASFTQLDVTNEDHWRKAVALAEAKFGGIDILVNNAGAAPSGVVRIDQEDPELHSLTLRICASSVWYGTRAVIASMRARQGGSIINIASIDSFIGVAGFSSFVAAKHAMLGITKSTALELGSLGIRVNAIHPGIIDTPMMAEAADVIGKATGQGANTMRSNFADRHPLKRMGRDIDVANAIKFLVSDAAAFVTGSELVVDGGMTAI